MTKHHEKFYEKLENAQERGAGHHKGEGKNVSGFKKEPEHHAFFYR